jgi:hypothetical protein
MTNSRGYERNVENKETRQQIANLRSIIQQVQTKKQKAKVWRCLHGKQSDQ